MTVVDQLPNRLAEALRRAFSQFLALPLAVVIAFAGLAVVIYWADTAWSAGRTPAGFTWLGEMLGDSQSLATLLSTVASSIITVTSITFSLLLIALQQGASALTAQVTDQFLMRRMNQFYFGYFVGLSVFVLISLVTASGIHRPVFGTTLALLLTAVALCMMVVMIYNTIDQMRPRQIVRAIHRHVLRARLSQVALLERSRRTPQPNWPVLATVRAEEAGHIVGVDADKIRAALSSLGEAEVQLLIPLGRYLAFGEPIAEVRVARQATLAPDDLKALGAAVLDALSFDDSRDLEQDPGYGITQLADIGWTSISTAKSNPDPGLAVIESLRDILSRWAAAGEVASDASSPVVMADAAPQLAIDALEAIIVATSESMQAQTLGHTLRTVSMLLGVVPDAWAERLADLSRRALTSLGEHVLTRDLERALDDLYRALEARGFAQDAQSMQAATRRLATTIGTLNSRSTRVPSEG